MPMEAKLIERCRELAADSRKEYLADHKGVAPQIDQNVGECDVLFQVDWRTLRREGAAAEDRIACRTEWDAVFFALQLAGGN
jgi:hypothetical protein